MDYFLNPKINANQCQLCCCCLDWLESWYLYFKNKKFGSKIKNWTLASVLEKCCFDPIHYFHLSIFGLHRMKTFGMYCLGMMMFE